jgi:TPP-dependent pyruvate/acetoin dehydrogenase alpha subunit
MGTPYTKTSVAKVHEKAIPFKIKTEVVDGNDVYKVYESMKGLLEYMKAKSKPVLLECLTYRWMGHSCHDQRPYRSTDEINKWKAKDPVEIAENQLFKKLILKKSTDIIKDDLTDLVSKWQK